jgi:hypothetical protein
MKPLSAALAGWWRFGRRRPFGNLLGTKLYRMGCSARDWRALSAMDIPALVDTLRDIARDASASYGFLERDAGDVALLAQRITGREATREHRFQRLFSGQVVQFLLMQKLHALTADEIAAHVRIAGLGRLTAVTDSGSGAMLIASHWGLGRLAPPLLVKHGIDLTAMAPFDFQTLLGIEGPGRGPVIELTKVSDVRALVAAQRLLRSGRVVHSTGDGLRGGKKSLFRFLDTDRPFSRSFAVLALQAQVPCFPVFVRADGAGTIILDIGEAIVPQAVGTTPGERSESIVRAYVTLLEQRWREDFGNITAHSLRLYADGWEKDGPIED